jgi:hypothetical protein
MTSRGRVLPVLTLLTIVLLPLAANAQAFVHDWSKRFGSVGDQDGIGVAVDAAGNVVIAGLFWGTVDFGGGPLTSSGDWDLYVAKFDAAGNHLWSRRFGDASGQLARAMCLDPQGNILFAGHFYGSVDFGGGPITSAGDADVFVAKLDPDGHHIWSYAFGDAGNQLAYAVAVDNSDNVILSGHFEGKFDFGDGPLISAGSTDIYIAKFDSAGNILWSESFGDAATQQTFSVAVDDAGNIISAGRLYGSADFGGGPLTSAGASDIYVAKFDGDGNHLWSQRYGDVDDQVASAVKVDSKGDVLVAGDFVGQVDFGGGVLTNGGWYNAFVVKFDSSGGHIWSQGFGQTGLQSVAGMVLDSADNVVITGYFDGTVDFGGGPLVCNVESDVFVAEFNGAGGHVWSDRFGDADFQYGIMCAVDDTRGILMTGWFLGGIDFGGGVMTSAGGDDIFLARFARPAPAIQAIVDVPGDQGGWVRLHFSRALHDRVGQPANPVINYHVFRRVDNAALAATVEQEGSVDLFSGDTPAAFGDSPLISFEGRTFWRGSASSAPAVLWEAVATVPARQQNAYIGLVPTLADSGAVIQRSVYFVMAQTTTPWVFYDSAPDSGYSVDNLSPVVPQGLTGAPVVSPGGLELMWQANTENDLSHYAVYRGTTSGFIPAAGNLLGTPSAPALADGGWTWNSGYYYKVSAVDVHGNESGHALLSPQQVTGVGGDGPPLASFLSQNSPNPFSASTRIVFGLREAADVRVRIYDVAGRLVRDLVDSHFAASRHVVAWDGRDDAGRAVASGMYFYRIDAGTFVQTRKLLLMR